MSAGLDRHFAVKPFQKVQQLVSLEAAEVRAPPRCLLDNQVPAIGLSREDLPGVWGRALTRQRRRTTIEPMEVRIVATPEQEAFIREGIASGRFARAEDAAREALHLWEERQRRRTELLIELDAAEASFARGESRRVGPESITEFIAGVKRRGRTRLNNPR
jgi:Arc/MetJ-type ribon-helix-helix transcriptional regulator